jgi:glycosyltransferase involved in cell wall biosynthesis
MWAATTPGVAQDLPYAGETRSGASGTNLPTVAPLRARSMALVPDRDGALRVHVLIDSLNWGGAETLLADYAAGAPAAGIRLSVGYLQDVNGSPSAVALRERGIEPELIGVRKLLDPEALLRVRRHVAAVAPDVVHTHLGAADVHGGLAARSLGLPSVSTIHVVAPPSTAGLGPRAVARERLYTAARRHASRRVIAVSDAARAAYLDAGRDHAGRVVTVHNGIAARGQGTPRGKLRRELGIAVDVPVVAMVSVLREGKGHDVAFAALAQLRERHPDVRLLVVGDGPARDAVHAQAREVGEHVVFAGFRRDVTDVLAASDVLLLPSRMDAFPTSLLEAAAVGVPAVATAVGGIPEIVRDGETGLLLANPPSADAVAAALERLLDDPCRRAALGRAARVRFAAHFTAERWAARCRAIYDDVLL